MENITRKITENCKCGFCNSEINPLSQNQKYCDRICKELAYHERRSNSLLAEKELKEYHNALNASHLKVIKGGKYTSAKINKRSHQFLLFCQSLFWPTREFSEVEQEFYKDLIMEYFEHCLDVDAKFIELIERAMLAKAYVDRQPNRFIASPILWFSLHYPHGLSGTFSWYKNLSMKRSVLPTYKITQKNLADAILNFCDSGDLAAIETLRNYLLEENRFDLLGIYVNALSYFIR